MPSVFFRVAGGEQWRAAAGEQAFQIESGVITQTISCALSGAGGPWFDDSLLPVLDQPSETHETLCCRSSLTPSQENWFSSKWDESRWEEDGKNKREGERRRGERRETAVNPGRGGVRGRVCRQFGVNDGYESGSVSRPAELDVTGRDVSDRGKEFGNRGGRAGWNRDTPQQQ